MTVALHTERLVLRPWREEDLPAFADLNADPCVMHYMPDVLDRTASDALAARIDAALRRRGFGLWAVEVIGGSPFIGFIGLSVPGFEAHFTPCVETGWRLARSQWGHGYATEGARRALLHGFEALALHEIVSFTAVTNQRSRAVMARLGMRYTQADEFDHPAFAAGHPLRRHVLYRATP